MLVDKFHEIHSPSARAEGVLGRLMRAFPARVLVADDVAPAAVAPAPVSRARPDATSTGLLARLDAWLWRLQQRETEAWLAQATDTADLESRMRSLERGRTDGWRI
ncbi:MAG: DUF3563 family protein [Lautropia sp.]